MRLINHSSIFYAILAALLFSLSSPFSKILLEKLPPTQMAAMLYLGAGLGMSVLYILRSKGRTSEKEARLTKKELPYILGISGGYRKETLVVNFPDLFRLSDTQS